MSSYTIPSIHLSNEFISQKVRLREKFSHKGSYGHAILLAGSYGKIGAAVLSARACMRSGVGLLTVHVPACGYTILQTALPEAMCSVDQHEKKITQTPVLDKYKAIGIGPGIGTDALTAAVLKDILHQQHIPKVIDADAINLLASNEELKDLLNNNCVLTPHIREFERLVGAFRNPDEMFDKLFAFNQKYKCIIVLKDAETYILDENHILYKNSTGNPGMATAGSGDVLTGIILGLLAQGYTASDAALIGTYFHGLAGDQAALLKGENALIASDIIEALSIEKIVQ